TVAALIYLVVVLVRRFKKRNVLSDPRARLLFVTLVSVLFHALIVSQKRIFYLIHILPWCALAVGVMMRDGMEWIRTLRDAKWTQARLVYRAAVVVFALA